MVLPFVVKVPHQCFADDILQAQVAGGICKGMTSSTDWTWEEEGDNRCPGAGEEVV